MPADNFARCRPDDFDALCALEAMTNDRIRDEVGEINLVSSEERLFGPGSAFARICSTAAPTSTWERSHWRGLAGQLGAGTGGG